MDIPFDEIGTGLADERGHEDTGRVIVDFFGFASLLNHTILHEKDLVSENHGLFLVMGDENHGLFELSLELVDLRSHLDFQVSIEVGKRLVQ